MNNIRKLRSKVEDLDYEVSSLENYIDDIENEIRDLEEERDKLIDLEGGYILNVENLADDFKAKLVIEIYEKLTLEEIQHLLKWKQGKGIDYEAIRTN